MRRISVLLVLFLVLLPVAEGQNLVQNPGFEEGFEQWHGTCPSPRITCSIVEDSIEGSKALKAEFDGGSGNTNFYQIYQIIGVKPNTYYMLSYFIKSVDRSDETMFEYTMLNSSQEKINCTGTWCNYFVGPAQPKGTHNWTKYIKTFRTTADTAYLKIRPRQRGTASYGTSFWDMITLKEFSEEKTNIVTIENGKISLVIDKDSFGGIVSIKDKASGTEFVKPVAFPILYRINYKKEIHTTEHYTATNLHSDCFNYVVTENPNKKEIVIKTCHTDLKMNVTSIIMLNRSDNSLNFYINVSNYGNFIIQSVEYPVLEVVPMLGNDSKDDYFVMPYHTGNLYNDLYSLPSTGEYYIFSNPGQTSMQFMAFYDMNESSSGLYIQSQDTEGYFKKFGFKRVRDSDKDVIEILYRNFIAENYGNDFSLGYNIKLKAFNGEWHDAGDIYKEWTRKQWWTEKSVFERKDVPQILFNANTVHVNWRMDKKDYFFINDYMKKQYLSEPYAIKRFGGIIYIPGGFWGRPNTTWCGIDYFYPYDGEIPMDPVAGDDLYEAIINLSSIGVKTYLWLSGNRWDIWETDLQGNTIFNDSEDFYSMAPEHVILREDGSRYYISDRFCMSDRHRYSALIDIGSKENNIMDKVIIDNIVRGMRRNASLMSLDQIVGGYTYADWNENSGHPLGYGKWMHERFVELLEEIKQKITEEGKLGDFGISVEETNEFYIPYLQTHLIRQARQHAFSVKGVENARSTNIALFSYVYSGYFIGIEEFGNVYNKWDINPLNFWRLGRTVLQGNVPVVNIWYNKTTNANDPLICEETFTFFKKLISNIDQSYRGAEILHPPEITGLPEDVNISIKDKRPYYINFFYKPVLFNAFKKHNGVVSYVFINVKENEKANIGFNISKGYGGIGEGNFTVAMNVNGEESVLHRKITFNSPVHVNFTIGYKDIVIIDVIPRNESPADINDDGCVDIQEMLNFIRKWFYSESGVGMEDIIGAIRIWKKGCLL